MTDTCVCCGQTVPEGRMVCPGCERKTEERCGQMESWGEKLVELEERAKSNSHRISDLEADNKALHQLTASVQVLAAKQQTVEENVQEIKRDVKTLKNIPARRWEGVLRAVVTAAAAGLIGFVLARLGLGRKNAGIQQADPCVLLRAADRAAFAAPGGGGEGSAGRNRLRVDRGVRRGDRVLFLEGEK